MSNDSVKKLHLNDKGFIAFDVTPGKKYKWMMHESQEWFDKAKKIQGPDWHWSTAKPVEYVFDSFGFRNDKELEEISQDEWWLTDAGCPTLGPGVNRYDTCSMVLSDIGNFGMYDTSLFGNRPEYTAHNLLELSKRWHRPPSRILLSIAENPTGTFKITDHNTIHNIDYAGSLLYPNEPDYAFFRDYESTTIPTSQHTILYRTIIKLCEKLGIELTFLNLGANSLEETTEISMAHQFKHDVDIFSMDLVGGTVGAYHKDDTFEQRQQICKERILMPILTCQPPKGWTLEDVGRDFIHPSSKTHQIFAENLANHFNLSYY